MSVTLFRAKQWVISVFLVVFLIERQKGMTLKNEHHRLVGAEYATGEE